MRKSLQATEIATKAAQAVSAAKDFYRQAQADLRAAVGADFPLSSLVGQPFVYHKTLWGSSRTGVVTDDLVKDYQYMEPFRLETGAGAASINPSFPFEPESLYVVYVYLEQESKWTDEQPEFWEYMFIKIN